MRSATCCAESAWFELLDRERFRVRGGEFDLTDSISYVSFMKCTSGFLGLG
jgi:hypothetical protein